MKEFDEIRKIINTEEHALSVFQEFIGFKENKICPYCKGRDFENNDPYYNCLICQNEFTCISASFIEVSGIPVLHWVYVIFASAMYSTQSPIVLSEVTGIDRFDIQSIIYFLNCLRGLE